MGGTKERRRGMHEAALIGGRLLVEFGGRRRSSGAKETDEGEETIRLTTKFGYLTVRRTSASTPPSSYSAPLSSSSSSSTSSTFAAEEPPFFPPPPDFPF